MLFTDHTIVSVVNCSVLKPEMDTVKTCTIIQIMFELIELRNVFVFFFFVFKWPVISVCLRFNCSIMVNLEEGTVFLSNSQAGFQNHI